MGRGARPGSMGTRLADNQGLRVPWELGHRHQVIRLERDKRAGSSIMRGHRWMRLDTEWALRVKAEGPISAHALGTMGAS